MLPSACSTPIDSQGQLPAIAANYDEFFGGHAACTAADIIPTNDAPHKEHTIDGLNGLASLGSNEPPRNDLLFSHAIPPSTNVSTSDGAANTDSKRVRVLVKSAQHLPKPDDIGTCDPYAVITIGSQKHQTKVVTNNHDPLWAEELEFIASESVEEQTFTADVHSFDRYTEHDYIGTATLALSAVWEGSDSAGTVEKVLPLFNARDPTSSVVQGPDHTPATITLVFSLVPASSSHAGLPPSALAGSDATDLTAASDTADSSGGASLVPVPLDDVAGGAPAVANAAGIGEALQGGDGAGFGDGFPAHVGGGGGGGFLDGGFGDGGFGTGSASGFAQEAFGADVGFGAGAAADVGFGAGAAAEGFGAGAAVEGFGAGFGIEAAAAAEGFGASGFGDGLGAAGFGDAAEAGFGGGGGEAQGFGGGGVGGGTDEGGGGAHRETAGGETDAATAGGATLEPAGPAHTAAVGSGDSVEVASASGKAERSAKKAADDDDDWGAGDDGAGRAKLTIRIKSKEEIEADAKVRALAPRTSPPPAPARTSPPPAPARGVPWAPARS